MKITKIESYEVLDSRGNPTVEVNLEVGGEFSGRAIVPSGASTGIHEALELRDKDPKRFHGLGVLKAVENVNNEISSNIMGKEFESQNALDETLISLDGTKNKSKLGANAILGVSMAFCQAIAESKNLMLYEHIAKFTHNSPLLPRPMYNIMNGGRHANWSTDVQEFMIVPMDATNFSENLRIASEIYHTLENIIQKKGMSTNVGNEGGFAPKLESNEQALDLIMEAIEVSGYRPGKDVSLALDVAASEFFIENKEGEDDDEYFLKAEKKRYTNSEWLLELQSWIKKYPLISIEDPFSQDSFYSWHEFLISTQNDLEQVVGDDLLVTNTDRIKKSIDMVSCNALLVKLNQIGTVTEAIKAMNLAKAFGWKNIVSHRSGESEDTFISHFAVGTGSGQIKVGAPSRTDRVSKYNELIRIERHLQRK